MPHIRAARIDHGQTTTVVADLVLKHGASTVLNIPYPKNHFPLKHDLPSPDETSVIKIGGRSACSMIVLSAHSRSALIVGFW